MGIRLLKMGMPLPFRAETVQAFARGVKEVLVIEEKAPNLESLVKDALYPLTIDPSLWERSTTRAVLASRPRLARCRHDLAVAAVRLARKIDPERLAPVPACGRPRIPLSVNRTPFYCSGVPTTGARRRPTVHSSAPGSGVTPWPCSWTPTELETSHA